MPGVRTFHLDRRGRRLWITLPEEDWTTLQQAADRRYVSVSGLVALVVDLWCDEQRQKALAADSATEIKAMLEKGIAEATR